MTYATENDIANEFKNGVFNANTTVNSSALSGFLSQEGALIDSYIVNRYALPISDPQAILVLKKIEIDLVAYRVAKIQDLKKSNPIPDGRIVQDLSNGASYRQSMKMLQALKNGELDLNGETEINPTGGLSSFATDNTDCSPVFKKCEKQW